METRLDELMQENGHLKRQIDYFESLLGNKEIFGMSEALRAVVAEFNGRLESSNRQWESDERRPGGDPQPPVRAARPEYK